MSTINGFPPVADTNAGILILGSMPSIRSLQAQEYYAHPRNSFWFIMTTLLGAETNLDYEQRKSLLLDNRIALWDVLNSCERKDFNQFLMKHPSIKAVFFNGSRAQQEHRKHVLPNLDKRLPDIEYHRLPSTSPAMASLTREQKLEQWALILQHL